MATSLITSTLPVPLSDNIRKASKTLLAFLLTLAFLLSGSFKSQAQAFTVPLCTTTLQITNGPSSINCVPASACNWSWSGPGLNFSCTNCQIPTITAPAPGVYLATVNFSGQSNGSITYSISFGNVDADNDLFNRCEDCNDNNALERPGQLWYRDFDNDGYAPNLTFIMQCQRPAGHKAIQELLGTTADCNDNNAAIRPGAAEVCDGVDNNCASGIDEGVLITYYRDQDGDGFGNPAMTIQGCSAPGGYVSNNSDCVDNSAVQRPGQTWYKDTDNDGYGAMGVASIVQCLRPAGYRAATELTGTANDCNDNNALERPGQQWYRDNDNDGYAQTGSAISQCSRPTGYKHSSELTSTSGDCNDNDAGIRPGVADILCNNIDEDCSGTPAADNAPPTAVCKNITVTLINNSATITASQIDNGSSDNCGGVTLSANPTTFDCSHLGQTVPVILTVTDEANNQVTCTANVTVTGACEGSCPENGTVLFASAPTPSQTGTTGTWTVPSGGPFKVRITAKGAKGGNSDVNVGGNGAIMIGEFLVASNQLIEANAAAPGQGYSANGGGGGGSGVKIENQLFIIAAGGGGAGNGGTAGLGGTTLINGLNGENYTPGTGNAGAGGVNGSGGGGGGTWGGVYSMGGGGGYLSQGGNGINNIATGGGNGFNANGGSPGGGGGFGGGGGAVEGAGGGGGYSGGGASGQLGGGGGGGSYNVGSNQNNTSGTNNAGGQVIIECLGPVTLAATATPTQPVCATPTQGSVAIDLTGDLNGNTTGVEYAIVSGSTFTGTPAFNSVTADPLNLTNGIGTTAGIYTVRIRLKYNPDLYVDRTYTITELNVGTIYVKSNATGSNNGTSWTDAYTDLQTALAVACPGSQIWVAAGTYKPTAYPTDCSGCSTNRDYTFHVKDGVALYGGFAGTENSPMARNIPANPTILSGDIGAVGDATDNAHHVVLASAPSSGGIGVTVDGFTITGGNANGGGSIIVNGNSTFQDYGGGMYTSGGTNTLNHNTLSGNSANSRGGGIYTFQGNNTLSNNTLSGNLADSRGGGIYTDGGINTLSNNTLSGNSAYNGGGIYTDFSNNTLSNNTLSGNSANNYGGGINTEGGTNTLSNNTLSENSANSRGGGIYTFQGTNTLNNNTLSGNSVTFSGGGIYTEGGTNTLSNNTLSGNSASEGGGIYTFQGTNTLNNNTLSGNLANSRGGGIFTRGGTNALNNNTLSGNSADTDGGGIYVAGDGANISTSVSNCLFVNNNAGNIGGGVGYDDLSASGTWIFLNCTFHNNTANNGGAFGIRYWDSGQVPPEFINCILWGNSSIVNNTGTVIINHSLLQGASCPTNATCDASVILGQDPLFVDAANGNLRLQACSPAINAGSNAAVPSGITTDLDGNPRFYNSGTVDMGAYEYQGVRPEVAPVCQNITVQLGVDNTVTVLAAQLNNGSTGCGNLSYLINGQASLAFDCDDLGTPQNVTLTVTDTYNSTATCQAMITVADDINPCCAAPEAVCKPFIAVLNGAQVVVNPADVNNGSTADCGLQSITVSPNTFNCSHVGPQTVTLTVTDINGENNACQAIVTVVDQTPPTITCPDAQTLILGANCTASLLDYRDLATTDDNCGVQSVTQSPAAGTLVSSAGNMTVTMTVTDVNGLTNSCTFTVTKVDNTPPSITCPATQTLVLGANCGATLPDYRNLATTGDNCGVQSVTQSPEAGTSVSGSGNMTVTLTVTDVNNRTTSCTFTVTKVDNTLPTITCPATQTLVLGANCGATLPDYTNLATTGDNCGVQSVTQSPEAGTSVSGSGNMTVTLTVTDVNNRTTSCTFTVTKVDNTLPTITCPATQTVVLGANCGATLPDYTNLATTADNCGVQSVTQSPEAGTSVSGSGNMTVTLTVTDVNNRTTSCTFTVTKVDNTLPTITCPATQTVVLGANCGATLPDYTNLATTGDNCGVQSVTQSPATGTPVSGAGNMTVTLTVTDLNGNETECTFTVTKVDQTPPTITCPATQTLVLGANCGATLPDYRNLATTGDNCGVQSVTQSPAAGTLVSGVGNMTVTLTVTDINGNPAQCSFTVTKVDQTPPTLVCKNTTVFIGNTGTYTLQPTDVFNATASSDNCSGTLTVTNISPAMVSCAQLNQTIPVTVTVQDASGNTATCTAQITVEEGSALPLGWSSDNIGNANGAAGYKACSFNGSFTVAASGFSTSSADVVHFTSQQLCGNGEITVRVMAVSGGGWAGVMLRESLAPGSRKITLKTQLTNIIRREIRSVTNGATSILNINRPQHVWLRLVRNGSNFIGYTSLDGTNWSFAFSASVSMPGCIYAGVFAESINANTTTSANFSNVSIIGAQNNLAPNPSGGVEDLDEIMPTLEVDVYPNPTSGTVNLSLVNVPNGLLNIQVVNALGKVVLLKETDGSGIVNQRLDLSDLAQGVYFITVQATGYAKLTKRVVLTK